jgi:cold-inducible RNA-binding protein
VFRSFVSPKISPLLKSVTVKENLNMKNIFVGNLSFGATEQAVRSLFEAYGTVDRVSIVTDRDSGQPRGFGFVEMTNDAEGDKAIASLNGRDLEGRTLNVNEARPRPERGSEGGGGGGRRRSSSRW